MNIKIGIKGRSETLVSENNTAIAAGSGMLPVFATPYMTALMENAAANSIAPYLDGGQSSVGTMLSVTHISATPVGMKAWAESEVTAVEGKKITFRVSAYDEAGPIGEGTHERFIIMSDKFLQKCQSKLG